MPSTKRQSDAHDESPPASKIARSESSDFSGAVKKKLSGASRTGQACDRCKVRKIRCDARLGGCSPCAQNNTECRTTDRITGRATSRGHTETIEAEIDALKQHLADLRQQLQEHGIEPRSQPIFRNSFANASTSPASSSSLNDPHNLSRILNPEPPTKKGRSRSAVLPEYKHDSVGDNYLGVSSINEWPSPVGGTHHALFGMHVDLKDFVSSDDSEMSRATTYQSFLDFIAAPRPSPPELPPYQQCRQMLHWYFKMMGAWLPVLHKPHFLAMVDRIYHDPTFTPSTPEKVQLHLVLAAMLYQFTARNSVSTQFNWSDHYRYALSYFLEIYSENSLPAIQALALVVIVLRPFPRPGAVWMASVGILAKSVEMGLHRSITAWHASESAADEHEIEMRKRVFWSILLCHVTVGARLGRPLIVRLDDFDVELPKALSDQLPEEEGEPEHKKCSFIAGISGFQFLVVQMQMYNSLYTIRPVPQPYEQVQKRLAKEIDVWVASIPSHLSGVNQTNLEDQGFRVYLEFGHQNLRLLLHHPSLCRKSDEDIMARNLDVCLDASSKLLRIAEEMRSISVLDTTWFNTTYLLAAMFTTLFAYSERKDRITSAELKSLKQDMDSWIDIMADVGTLLGSGSRLSKALRQITNAVLADINRHIAAKTASAAYASANNSSNVPSRADTAQRQSDTYQHRLPYNVPQYPHQPSDIDSQASFIPPNQYPTNSQFAYPEPAPSMAPYTESMYPESYDDMKPDIAQLANSAAMASAAHHSGSASANPYYGYTNGNTPNHAAINGNAAWRNFADTMTSSIAASSHWPANALMSLGQSPAVANAALKTPTGPSPGAVQAMNGAPSVAAHSSAVTSTAGAGALNGGTAMVDGQGMGNGTGMAHGMGFDGIGATAWPIMGLYAAPGTGQ